MALGKAVNSLTVPCLSATLFQCPVLQLPASYPLSWASSWQLDAVYLRILTVFNHVAVVLLLLLCLGMKQAYLLQSDQPYISFHSCCLCCGCLALSKYRLSCTVICGPMPVMLRMFWRKSQKACILALSFLYACCGNLGHNVWCFHLSFLLNK